MVSSRRFARPKSVSAQLLDFAGQTEYYLGHQSYLGSMYAVYIVVGQLMTHPLQRDVDAPGGISTTYNGNDKLIARLTHWLTHLVDLVGRSSSVPVVVALDVCRPLREKVRRESLATPTQRG